MAAKKAELEEHRSKYHVAITSARAALKEGLYREAVAFAISSLDFIDGMMQYEKKYEAREFESIGSIDLLLKYAPFLLEFEVLDHVETLLKSQRRIERNSSRSLADELDQSRARMWAAYRLWNHLEHRPGARQDTLGRELGGSQDEWRSLAEQWERMGLVDRKPEGGSYRLALSTRMSETVLAKCPACGVVARASKSKFLEDRECPKCQVLVSFVVLAKKPDDVG